MNDSNRFLASLWVSSRSPVLAAATAAATLLSSACGDETLIGTGLATIGEDAAGQGGDGLSGNDATTGADGSLPLDVAIIGGDAAIADDTAAGGGGGDSAGGGGGTDASVTDTAITDPNLSCAGKCGKYDKGAACQCDDKCAGANDCCGDYTSLCTSVTPGGCGDGKCTPPEDQKSCPADCGTIVEPAGSCVGKCGKYNKSWTCQCDDKCAANKDCCADLATACPVVGPNPTCGDGTCNGGETTATCAKDCPATGGGGTSPIVSCVETNCASDVATCLANTNCAKVFDCAKACTSQNCLFGCVQQGGGGFQLPDGLTGLYNCGNQFKCFDAATGGGGGGGGGPTTSCGDGTCNGNETTASCPKDCPGGGGGSTTPDQCLAAACSKTWNDCQANAACKAAVPCMESGKQVWQCITNFGDWQAGQVLVQLQQCGNQNKCL